MDEDEIVRWAFLAAGAAAALAYLLGGLLTRIEGVWHDGQRHRVTLHQLGPWVWGEASWPSGRQTYRGRAVWGRVRLVRADFGDDHLRNLGFNAEQIPLLGGKVTGHLHLRVENGALVGRFFGRKFSFEQDGSETRIKDVQPVAAVERTWTRVDASDPS